MVFDSLRSFHLTLRTQSLLGFGLVLAVSAAVSAIAYANTVSYREAALWVRHTEMVIDAAETAHLTVENLDDHYREYLLTGSDSALAAYRKDVDTYRPQLQRLGSISADNPAQAARWVALEAWVDQLTANLFEPGIALRQTLPVGAAPNEAVTAFDLSSGQQRAMAQSGAVFEAGVQIEHDLLAEHWPTVAERNTLLFATL